MSQTKPEPAKERPARASARSWSAAVLCRLSIAPPKAAEDCRTPRRSRVAHPSEVPGPDAATCGGSDSPHVGCCFLCGQLSPDGGSLVHPYRVQACGSLPHRDTSESSLAARILDCGDLSPLCLRRLVADAARRGVPPGKRRQVGTLHIELVAALPRCAALTLLRP